MGVTLMAKRLVLGGIAAALLATAPLAHAGSRPERVRSGCGSEAVAADAVTGGQDTFEGSSYGYAAFAGQGTHTLRCRLMVDGVEQASTPLRSGSGVVRTAAALTYHAPEGATVDLCTEVDGATLLCETATETRLPPRAPTDAYDAVPWLLPAPCPAVRPGRRNAPSDCPPYRPPDTLPGLSDGAVRFQHT
jgi:hypothetical protein